MTKKHLPLFHLLVEASNLQRKALVKTMTVEQLHAVTEAIFNVLRGVCPIKKKDKTTLTAYKDNIRRLVSNSLTSKQRKRLLNKHVTILPILLKPVLRHFKRFYDTDTLRRKENTPRLT